MCAAGAAETVKRKGALVVCEDVFVQTATAAPEAVANVGVALQGAERGVCVLVDQRLSCWGFGRDGRAKVVV